MYKINVPEHNTNGTIGILNGDSVATPLTLSRFSLYLQSSKKNKYTVKALTQKSNQGKKNGFGCEAGTRGIRFTRRQGSWPFHINEADGILASGASLSNELYQLAVPLLLRKK